MGDAIAKRCARSSAIAELVDSSRFFAIMSPMHVLCFLWVVFVFPDLVFFPDRICLGAVVFRVVYVPDCFLFPSAMSVEGRSW